MRPRGSSYEGNPRAGQRRRGTVVYGPRRFGFYRLLGFGRYSEIGCGFGMEGEQVEDQPIYISI